MMLNELFAREILETSIALGILQEMNGGVVIYSPCAGKAHSVRGGSAST